MMKNFWTHAHVQKRCFPVNDLTFISDCIILITNHFTHFGTTDEERMDFGRIGNEFSGNRISSC